MNTFRINVNQFESDMQRLAIFELAITTIILIALFWATYWVIKAGVRDGIKEATPWHRAPAQPALATAPAGYRWALVKEAMPADDMRAD